MVWLCPARGCDLSGPAAGIARGALLMAGARGVRVPEWIPRWLANLLLIGITLYLGVALAWLTWFVLWDEKPVTPLYQPGAVMMGERSSITAPLASYEIFGRAAGDQPV